MDAVESLARRGIGRARRFLARRGLWKEVNYAFAAVTYVASGAFFLLGLRELIRTGASMAVTDDLLAALWFLLQGPFLFALTWGIERRRQNLAIRFPDRRAD